MYAGKVGYLLLALRFATQLKSIYFLHDYFIKMHSLYHPKRAC